MNKRIEEIIDKLRINFEKAYDIEENEFIANLYQICDELDTLEDSFNAIEPILKIIENEPDLYFGSFPGPLGHFMEKHYKKGYEQLLISSIERNPTSFTLQMLHRLINDRDNPDRLNHLKVMKKISLSKEYSEDIVNDAKDSLTYFE